MCASIVTPLQRYLKVAYWAADDATARASASVWSTTSFSLWRWSLTLRAEHASAALSVCEAAELGARKGGRGLEEEVGTTRRQGEAKRDTGGKLER